MDKETREKMGKIILDQKVDYKDADWESYAKMLRLLGGFPILFLFVFAIYSDQFLQFKVNGITNEWSELSAED